MEVAQGPMSFATYEDVVQATPTHTSGASLILDYTQEQIRMLYEAMTPVEKQEFERLLMNMPPKALMPHQVVPDPFSKTRKWEIFLLIGGRGVAKTTALSFAMREHLRHHKTYARILAGAPTAADARDVLAEGDTGLIKMFPNEFTKYNRSLGEARHIFGGLVKFMGTEQPGRWNGPQGSMLVMDELALCNPDSFDQAQMGLRLKGPNGEDPYAVFGTTPKAKKWVKALAQEKTTLVPRYIDEITGEERLPTTFDNPYLPEKRVQYLKNKYLGTRTGKQELLGQFIDDVAGARFNRDWIVYQFDPKKWPRMHRIVVAVDPAGSVSRMKADENALTPEQKQNQVKNADTGIAVIGLGIDGRIYVLALLSGQWSPAEWGAQVLRLFSLFRADKIIAESNFGGLMVESNIRNIDVWDEKLKIQLKGKYAPIKLIHASKGKHIRAEPVAALYEQNAYNPMNPKIIHCRVFSAGEDQMCSFINADENEGADMVDALVWGVLEITGMAEHQGQGLVVIPQDNRISQFIQVIR